MTAAEKGPENIVQLFLVISGAVWTGSRVFNYEFGQKLRVSFSNSLKKSKIMCRVNYIMLLHFCVSYWMRNPGESETWQQYTRIRLLLVRPGNSLYSYKTPAGNSFCIILQTHEKNKPKTISVTYSCWIVTYLRLLTLQRRIYF